MKIDAKTIIKGFDKAKADRVTWEDTWEDLVYYTLPRKRGIQNKYEPGERIQFDVYDDTAITSNMILAAGLSGYMTNASQRWFELRTRDERLMDEPGVRKFFDTVTDTMYSALASSNFYLQIHELYLDLGSIGTATLYEEEDPLEDLRFFARPPKEVYAIENSREQVDIVYRKFELSAYAAYTLFGRDNVGEVVIKAVEEQRDFGKLTDYLQYVGPRHERDVSKTDKTNLPFFSYWVDMKMNEIVGEGGYEEFPFFVTRFYKNSAEPYGYSPAFTVLPDILMINKMMKVYIEGAEIAIYPPWLQENDGVIGTLDLRAAAINYQRQPLSQGAAVQPMVTKMNGQIAIDFIERTSGNIKASFFTDLFLMLTQHHNMTATEVIERTQEKMLMLGPVLGRLQAELLNPIIRRTFNILLRRGKLPEVPQVLVDADYDIVYISALAKAQRAVQAKDMQTFLAMIGNMAAVMPNILDNINQDEVVSKLSKVYSIDPEVIRDEKEIQAIREARDQQQQMAQKLEFAERAAGINKAYQEGEKNAATARATG